MTQLFWKFVQLLRPVDKGGKIQIALQYEFLALIYKYKFFIKSVYKIMNLPD